jgi:hypothetical protein
MSERLLMLLGGLKIVQTLSAVSILVLAFVAQRYIFVCVSLFGLTMALSAAILIVESLMRGRLLYGSAAISRAEQPLKFWGLIGLRMVALLIGLGLTQVWRLHQ